jgi:glycosyltransferase involved in cell wall biosynthesis
MKVAWFSPLPPARTGIAGYSADVLPLLEASGLDIDRYEERNAHDFVWRRQQHAYDLVVYQLGNSTWHDFIWGYLFNYPGLVVLHDTQLHHARAAQLLRARRVDDYRREFAYDQPGVSPAASDFAVEGLTGSAYYRWPMTRAGVESARLVAVHSDFAAEELRARHPGVRIERIRLSTTARNTSPTARADIRRRYDIPANSIVFVAFGLITAEKRIEPVLRALGSLVASGDDVHLLVGGENGFPGLAAAIEKSRVSDRVHVAGYVEEARVADFLAAGDVSLSLRWPTAGETSASWIESLAAAKPTIITALPHNANVPRSVAIAVDLLEEDAGLVAAMSMLARDRALRETLGRAAYDYWKAEHHVSLTADDYRRVIAQAAQIPAMTTLPAGLPAHLTSDHSARAMSIAREFDVDVRLKPDATADAMR